MLQKMRSSTGSWIAKGILGLLILSFGAWGLADYAGVGLGGGRVAAEVGDREIGIVELTNAYQAFLQQNNLVAVEPETAQQLGLAETVLGNLTTRALYEAEAASLNLTASDDMVRRDLESRPEFQSVTGQFDRLRFEQYLSFSRLTEQGMVATVRQDLGRAQLIGAVTAGSDAPNAVVDMLFDHFGERRSAEILRIDLAAQPTPAEPPSDADLASFFEDRQEDFRRPELRALTYVLISPEAIAADMDIDEETVRADFEARREQFIEPETRDIAQIIFPDEAQAAAAADALRSVPIEEIDAQAEALGLSLVELGAVTRAGIPVESLADAAFGLDDVGVTDPFQGAFGWSVAVVRSVTGGTEPNYEDVRDMVRRDLALERAYNEVFERGDLLEDGYGQGMSLEEAATSIGLAADRIDAVDSSGRGPDGTAIEGLPTGLTFLRTAYDLEEGETSFLETAENDAMFMVRVDAIIPSAIPPLEEVRGAVVAAWLYDQTEAAAEDTAIAIVDALNAGADASTAAASVGASLDTVEGFARTGEGPNGTRVPPELAGELFGLAVGQAAYAPDGTGFVVGRLTEITDAASASNDAFRENLSNVVARGMAEDLIEQLGAALRVRHSVSTYPGAIEQVYFGQSGYGGMAN
jgi:peptidyl-prolyl cis-trans isomerase D